MKPRRKENKIIATLLAVTGLVASPTSHANSIPLSPELLAWRTCGDTLAVDRLANPNQVKAAMYALATYSVDQSFDFLRFATTVIAAESGFNRYALSPSGAVGLMQVTPIGAREAAVQCRLPLHGGDDASIRSILFDSRTNVKYGTCLLKYYLDSVQGNKTLALVLYNGGYQQLTRLINTGTLSKETSEYVLRVNSYLGRCQ